MMRKCTGFILVLIWYSYSLPMLYAQEADVWFQHLTVGNGLPGNFVIDMAQDSLGFLWVGTSGGLARYDGYGFDVFQPNPDDTTAMRDYVIQTLHTARDGTLWIGTQHNGISRYDADTQAFYHYPFGQVDDTHLTSPYVLAFTEASDATLWIGTQDGLDQLDPLTGRFNHFRDGLNFQVGSLWADEKSGVWAGVYQRGLYRFDTETGEMQPHAINGIGAQIFVIQGDAEGNLWLGTSNGLWRYDPATRTPTDFSHLPEATQSILDILVEAQGDIWFSTSTGIYLLDPATAAIRVRRSNASGNAINLPRQAVSKMIFDEAGIFWLGIQGWGIAVSDFFTSRFPLYRHNPNDPGSITSSSIRSVWGDTTVIWVGMNAEGLNHIDRATGVVTHFPRPTPQGVAWAEGEQATVWAINVDQEGALWILLPWGLEKRAFRTGDVLRRYAFPDKRFQLSDPGFVYQDRQGKYWVGSTSLLAFDPETGAFTSAWDEDTGAGAVAETSDGRLWIGTKEGLVRYTPATGERVTYKHDPREATSLSNNYVGTIWAASDTVLWIGTGAGLNRFDIQQERFERFTTYNSDLPDNFINGVLGDAQGHLWVSTNRGLARMDTQTHTFVSFQYERGLQGVEFNRGAYAQARDGLLLFGGEEGLNAFDPLQLRENPFPPRVYLKHVKQGAKVLYQGPRPQRAGEPPLRLKYTQNDLSIAYLGLHYSAPQLNRYQYKLLGSDEDWQPVTTRREVQYTNLDAGDYTFLVRASNAYGVWSEDVDLLTFQIRPPWWATWWFRVFALVGTAVFVVWGYRRRVSGLNAHREVLQQEVAARTADLMAEQQKTAQQADVLERLNRQQQNLFVNVSHETRTPLTLILSPIEDLLEHRAEEVSDSVRATLMMVRRNAQRLLYFINKILDLSRLEAGHVVFSPRSLDLSAFMAAITDSFQELAQQKGINLLFDTSEMGPVVGRFDVTLLEHIFFNLIANAIKYTPEGGKVLVSLYVKDTGPQRVALARVSDTGIGIPQDQLPFIFDRYALAHTGQESSTGIGLALVKEAVDLHGGTVDAMSAEGFGALFTVRLPVGDSQEAEVAASSLRYDPELLVSDEQESAVVTEDEEEDRTTVLIVEDNEEIRHYIASLLSDTYRVLQAQDGVEGLELTQRQLPDLIISDVMMPRLDGVAFCAAVKEDPALQFIPTILLTAKADVADRIAGLEACADDYIAKPFNVRELQLRVRNLIDSRRKWKKQFSAAPLRDAFPEATSVDEALRQQIEQVVHERFTESDFSASQLAEAVGISPAHLRRKMQALFQQSPVQVIRSYRLEQAALQLRKQTGTVSEIAYAVGFNSVSYFTRAFREVYDVPPSAYPIPDATTE